MRDLCHPLPLSCLHPHDRRFMSHNNKDHEEKDRGSKGNIIKRFTDAGVLFLAAVRDKASVYRQKVREYVREPPAVNQREGIRRKSTSSQSPSHVYVQIHSLAQHLHTDEHCKRYSTHVPSSTHLFHPCSPASCEKFILRHLFNRSVTKFLPFPFINLIPFVS